MLRRKYACSVIFNRFIRRRQFGKQRQVKCHRWSVAQYERIVVPWLLTNTGGTSRSRGDCRNRRQRVDQSRLRHVQQRTDGRKRKVCAATSQLRSAARLTSGAAPLWSHASLAGAAGALRHLGNSTADDPGADTPLDFTTLVDLRTSVRRPLPSSLCQEL